MASQKKQVNQSFVNSKEFAESLIRTANVIIVGLNNEGKINLLNETAEKISGYSFSELEGKDWFEILVPEEKYPHIREKFVEHTAKGKIPETFKNHILTKSGEERYISWQNNLLVEGENRIGTISFGVDITESKMAEKSLQESEEKYRTLLEFAPDAFFQGDRFGNFITVNNKAVELTGFNREELLKMNMLDLFPAKVLAEKPLRYDLLKPGETLINKREIRNKSGALIPVEMNSKIMPDGTYQCFMRDFKERNRMEEALRESEERHRLIAENVSDVIWTASLDGHFTYVSPSVINLRGYTSEEVLSQSIDDSLTPESAEIAKSLLTDFHHTLKLGKIPEDQRFEVEQRCRDGSTVWTEVTASGMYNKSGEFICIMGVTRDISERKKTEEVLKRSEANLRELNATKDKFFTIIAHDLRNPFNSIIGFSDMMERQVKQGNFEEIERFSGIIHHSSLRVMDLLSNLMDWARSQTGAIAFSPEMLDMAELIRKTVEVVNDYALQKSITITCDLPRQIHMEVDRPMLSTIFRNLVSNAIKFSFPKGQILISAEQKNGEYVFSVQDYGIGIRPDVLDKLFRIDQSYTSNGTQNEKGSGLGLLLCKEFVDRHSGRIWVESEQWKGSIFYFTLPF
jgi:PAS domain S-box-containing protein